MTALGWHARRFEKRTGAVHIPCDECGRDMWLPPSKIGEYHRCGQACAQAARLRKYQELLRDCETCGKQFRPRPTQVRAGCGRFCSQACNTASREALLSPEAMALARERYRELDAKGLIRRPRGPESASWKGGPEEARRRRRESGKAAAELRAYRAKNKHRVREWDQNRKNGKLGRLPWGTIPRLGKMQRWKCAICRTSIKDAYHVDHIQPIAKGGKHAPRNLQLLCGPCNVRKSARDPIIHMQSLGRLL